MIHGTTKKQFTRLGVLSALGFEAVEDAPTVVKWLANYASRYTRLAYRSDLRDFVEFTGITAPIGFTRVRSSHVIAWRDAMTSRGLAASTVRRKLAALSKLFEALHESREVDSNPVLGVRRPNKKIPSRRKRLEPSNRSHLLFDGTKIVPSHGAEVARYRAYSRRVRFTHHLRRKEPMRPNCYSTAGYREMILIFARCVERTLQDGM